jgi:hypothetical protein
MRPASRGGDAARGMLAPPSKEQPMNRQRNQHDTGRRGADAGHATDVPHARGHGARPGRLDTLEWADDRTAALDPHRGSVDRDPMDDLLEGRRADADYREDANRVTPTLGPDDPAGDSSDQ